MELSVTRCVESRKYSLSRLRFIADIVSPSAPQSGRDYTEAASRHLIASLPRSLSVLLPGMGERVLLRRIRQGSRAMTRAQSSLLERCEWPWFVSVQGFYWFVSFSRRFANLYWHLPQHAVSLKSQAKPFGLNFRFFIPKVLAIGQDVVKTHMSVALAACKMMFSSTTCCLVKKRDLVN